ncbi:hypothetical protein N9N67_07820 [Bacteriovoracaceae bacterium]|nr:hypothetical protein [Bacteriovoracaceae bacterium]
MKILILIFVISLSNAFAESRLKRIIDRQQSDTVFLKSHFQSKIKCVEEEDSSTVEVRGRYLTKCIGMSLLRFYGRDAVFAKEKNVLLKSLQALIGREGRFSACLSKVVDSNQHKECGIDKNRDRLEMITILRRARKKE